MRPGARWITERAGGQRFSRWLDGCCSFQTLSFWTTGTHPGQAQKKPAGNQRAENLWRRGGDSNSRYLSGIHDFQSCSFGHLGHLSVCSDVSSLNGDGWQVFFCVLGGFLSGCMKNVWNACGRTCLFCACSGPCVRPEDVFSARVSGKGVGFRLDLGFRRASAERFSGRRPFPVWKTEGRGGEAAEGRPSVERIRGANP